MRVLIRSSTFSRITGAVAALWLCGGGAAWAGGGADLASLQTVVNGLCVTFGISPCLTLPNITQAVLEVAALGNNLPEMARAQNAIPQQFSVDAGNPAALITLLPAVSNTQPPVIIGLPRATTTPNTSAVLATLTPLAFISQSSGAAKATQPYDSSADTFLYAVGVSSQGFTNAGGGGLTNPDRVYFFYDDTSRTNANLNQSQIVANFTFPLTVLNNNGSETSPVTGTLQFKANNARDCSTSSVIVDFSGIGGSKQTVTPPNNIGIDCAVVFSPSPTSAQPHAIFEVAIPLLVTGACKNDPSLCLGQPPIPVANADPPYFYFAINDLPGNLLPSKGNLGPNLGTWTAFGADGDVLGATPTTSGILPAGAYSIGLAPSAGPLGAPTCTLITPSDPTQTPFYSCSSPWKYALCASLPTNGNGQSPRPAVATYYAVATSGETWLSAPYRPFLQFDGTPAFVCPSGM